MTQQAWSSDGSSKKHATSKKRGGMGRRCLPWTRSGAGFSNVGTGIVKDKYSRRESELEGESRGKNVKMALWATDHAAWYGSDEQQ